MGRWREAATDALGIFTASRLLVLAALLWPPSQIHAYLTTWDAGFYLTIARCGYDPACGPPVSAELPAFFPLQAFMARVAGTVGISEAWGGAAFAALASLGRPDPAPPPVQRVARPPHGAPRLRRPRVLPVRVRTQHELLGGPVPAGLDGAFTAARSRHLRGPVLAFLAGLAAGLTRQAAIPLALGLATDAYLFPGAAARLARGCRGSVAGVIIVFADLKRRRDDWLASLHAQQLGWDRSTSVVDAPGELARYVWDAITLGHAQNLLYLTAVPLAVVALIVLWRSGIRDGMFAYAVIAVVAPLATGSAMSLPRFLMGTFPYAVAGGILLDRMGVRLRAASWRSAQAASCSACGRPIAAAGSRPSPQRLRARGEMDRPRSPPVFRR